MLKCGHCHARVRWRDDVCPVCGRLIINDRQKRRILASAGAALVLAAVGGGLLLRPPFPAAGARTRAGPVAGREPWKGRMRPFPSPRGDGAPLCPETRREPENYDGGRDR